METWKHGYGAAPMLLVAATLLVAPAASAQSTRVERVVIPADTVVQVRLDDPLSTRNTHTGDRFTATVTPEDQSGLPLGTRLEGVVTEARRPTKDRPGVLASEFRHAILPDGRRAAMTGRLASLDEDAVRRTSTGRLEARDRKGKDKIDWKWAGIGAGGGAVLAEVFGGEWWKGLLFGGLGGAVYGYLNRDKNEGSGDFREVELDRGTRFGVRLTQQVAFADRDAYRYYASDDRYRTDPEDRYGADYRDDRVLGSRIEYGARTAVTVDGRAVDFPYERPISVDGVLYVPLSAIAGAADMEFEHRRGEARFALETPGRRVTGDATVLRTGQDRVTDGDPILVRGEVYVPVSYLRRNTNLRVNWDRQADRLELETR